jgi:hypothetical protein
MNHPDTTKESYSYGPRKLNIILTQLHCNASFLNYDLCKVKMLSNASCNCGAPCENSHPFFLELNIQRMIIYKNIGLDNIRKKRIKKKEKRINTFGDVRWFFRSFRQL